VNGAQTRPPNAKAIIAVVKFVVEARRIGQSAHRARGSDLDWHVEEEDGS
jgi:hypothetical protein